MSARPEFTHLPAVSFCEGEEKEVGLSAVSPDISQGTTLTWSDEPDGTVTTIQGLTTGLSISAIPVFDSSKADSNHRSTYSYYVRANFGYCTTKPEEVKVYVDEELSGTLRDTFMCEGSTVPIDASNYQALSYTWTAEGEPSLNGAVQTVSPKTTTLYRVDMSRGECRDTGYVTVTVNSNPRIYGVDSAGVRSRQIVLEDGYGTAPYQYWVDDNRNMASGNPVIDNLTFDVTHRFHVIDYYGCVARAYNQLIPAPPIFIPDYFSPNGDGTRDYWTVGNLSDVYPDAVVTVYDRFGKVLIQYHGGDTEGWDGKYLGKDMPSTDYWYVIEIKEIQKQYVGHFTLMRR